MFYGEDLAHVHHAAFTGLAADAAPAVIDELHAAGITHGLVLDLACGSGVLSRELLSAGYDVLGIDVSAAMIALARQVAPGAAFLVDSVHSAQLPRCSGAVSIGEGLTYMPAEANAFDPARVLHRIHDALVPGGVLLFDAIEHEAGELMEYDAERSGPDWQVFIRVREDAAQCVITREIRITRHINGVDRTSSELHRLRTFGRRELLTILETAGFEAELTERYGVVPLGPRRVVCRARKGTGAA